MSNVVAFFPLVLCLGQFPPLSAANFSVKAFPRRGKTYPLQGILEIRYAARGSRGLGLAETAGMAGL